MWHFEDRWTVTEVNMTINREIDFKWYLSALMYYIISNIIDKHSELDLITRQLSATLSAITIRIADVWSATLAVMSIALL